MEIRKFFRSVHVEEANSFRALMEKRQEQVKDAQKLKPELSNFREISPLIKHSSVVIFEKKE